MPLINLNNPIAESLIVIRIFLPGILTVYPIYGQPTYMNNGERESTCEIRDPNTDLSCGLADRS